MNKVIFYSESGSELDSVDSPTTMDVQLDHQLICGKAVGIGLQDWNHFYDERSDLCMKRVSGRDLFVMDDDNTIG